jgi:sphinganine-1-phosphate aldolase
MSPFSFWIVLIRTLRPSVYLLGGMAWLVYRMVRLIKSGQNDDPTILDGVLAGLKRCQREVWDRIRRYSADSPNDETVLLERILLSGINFGFQILQDLFGIFVIFGSLRMFYCLYQYTWTEIKVVLEDSTFEWAKRNIPVVSRKLDEEMEKQLPEMEQSYGRGDLQEETILELPSKGKNPWLLFQELAEHATKEHTATWKRGKTSGTVYVEDEKHIQFMNEVYGLYSFANNLHAGMWPKLTQCESELIAMTSHLLHNESGVGCTTSGGTESIMLAIKAHWIYYGKRRGISHPELVCATNVHAAVDKACEVFGIRKVTIDCNNRTTNYTLCPKQVEGRITSNTIMIVASAPNYPQGTIDPIEELGAIAQRFRIGFHVDACLGGFVLPFAPQGSFPTFDFQVPGVTSMSVDTHKFGYAPKGTSIVLYRDKKLRHAQYFCYARWTGGLYATPTFAGSRPSALVGCAWASLVAIGYQGYQQRTHQLLTASRTITDGIRTEIPELFVLGPPEEDHQAPTIVVCFGSDTLDIYRVSDIMQTKGWALNGLQNPASVHICVTLPIAPHAEQFVQDLKESAALLVVEEEEQAAAAIHNHVERTTKRETKKKQGTAGIYGMAGSIPEGPVNDVLKAFLDVGLTPSY